jgi:predicted deacylase
VRAGVTGVLRVMRHLGMVSGRKITKPKTPSIRSSSSFWVRPPAGGLLRMFKDNGEEV